MYTKHQELKQASVIITSWSLVTAEALGEIFSLVTIQVQVELGCLHLVSVLPVSLAVPPPKVLVAFQVYLKT